MSELTAAQLMKRTVTSVEPTASLQQVGQRLLAGPYSGMPVIDADRRVIGMITEFDLLKAVSAGQDLAETSVDTVMSRNVVTLDSATPLSKVVTVMLEAKVRRVPLTEQGRLAGILSRADLLHSLFQPAFAAYWSEWNAD